MSREEDIVRRLAEAKAHLERKVAELEREISANKAVIAVLDEVLAEKSFKRLKVEVREKPVEVEIPPPVEEEKLELTTVDGVFLGELLVRGDELLLFPAQNISFRVDLPPFTSFLINRVLEPMRRKDEEEVASGTLPSDKAFKYEVSGESGILKSLRILNYGDARRLNELRNAIRWTLRRLYEKGG
ncbi:MAG: hypothetical protein QW569_05190 [Candidatus Bathyarchaeia archaeon]|nr:hypothetical protein [Candidatus Bathyarchaeota archaeon]